MRRWIKFCLCLVCTLLAIAACQRPAVQETALPPNSCQVVQHVMGETCVPLNPQRIVTLDGFGLDALLALGVQPVGAANPFSSYLDDRLVDIPLLGRPQEPSLERIVMLKPDLILAFSWYHQPLYDRLSQIAPTVVYDFNHGREVREIVQFIGQTIGQPEKAAQVLADYDRRLAALRANMTSPPTVSLIRIHQQGVGLMQRGSFPGYILEQAGLSRPANQQGIEIDKENGVWRHIQINISKEQIAEVDADVLFVFNDVDPSSEQRLQQMKTDPLWSRLDVVQRDRVYEVPAYWGCCGLIAANRVVDDLWKYVVEQP
ncbi:MAG: iron-siderophore ABC transporter substrate-binding protein [Desertifilum sp.]|nr:iron-siderophore ABC transporter substrate-binding protein [Desertifilum sp.]